MKNVTVKTDRGCEEDYMCRCFSNRDIFITI